MEPFDPPKQETFICVWDELMAGGWVKVTLLVFTHPFASVTVAVYVPGPKLEMDGVVCPPGAQFTR